MFHLARGQDLGGEPMTVLRKALPWAGGALVLTIALSAFDPQGASGGGWLAYLALSILGAALLWAAWRWVTADSAPTWLGAAVAVALVLRVGIGIALTRWLPAYGNDSPQHNVGYFYPDAYQRDTDAWQLATSSAPLTSAFTQRWASDQYGGLLFISALTYRVLSPGVHRPLLIVLLGSVVSSLAVLFTWAFAAMTFGRKAGAVAAWVMAFYPEAVLLAATQMREPYLGTGLALALYGYARVRIGSLRPGIAAIAAGFALALLLSPPYAFVALAVVGVAWLWEGRAGARWRRAALAGLAVFAVAALALTVRSWSVLYGAPGNNALALLRWWTSEGAQWEEWKLGRASGWAQEVFTRTPDWAHAPLVTLNGVVQVFLPAALTEPSIPLMQAIAIWRSLGWFFLLPFLIYAPLAGIRWAGWRGLATYLSLLAWAAAIFVAYRFAGDQWDNPRYREIFLSIQAAVAGWAWAHAGRVQSPWLKRAGALVGGLTLIFLHWYVGRYFHTPKLSLWTTLAVCGVFAAGLLLGSVVFDTARLWRARGLGKSPLPRGG